MKLSVTCFLIFTVGLGFAQPNLFPIWNIEQSTKKLTVENTDTSYCRFKTKEEVKQGICKCYHKKTEKKILQVKFKNDIITGRVKFWYPSGPLKTKAFLSNGLFHGRHISYYPSGGISEKIILEKGYKQGEHITYYPSGKTKVKINFEDGVAQGDAFGFYPNGNTQVHATYVDNQLEGDLKYFSSNGKLFRLAKMHDNELQRLVEYNENGYPVNELKVLHTDTLVIHYFDSNGEIKHIETYHQNPSYLMSNQVFNHHKLSHIHYYDSTNTFLKTKRFLYDDAYQKIKSEYWLDTLGTKNGLEVNYYEDDSVIASKIFYVDGIQEGSTTTFYKNGQKWFISTYKNGVLHGREKGWYPSGKLKFMGQYHHGEKIGTWYIYDEAKEYLSIKREHLNNLNFVKHFLTPNGTTYKIEYWENLKIVNTEVLK